MYASEQLRAHLILPPFPFLRKERILPLNLAYLAAMAPRDIALSVLDANLGRMSAGKFAQTVAGLASDALLFTAHTYQTPFVFQAAAAAKKIRPDVLTVIGGPHATALPEETLRHGPALDLAVIGEGEYTLRDILAARRDGGRLDEIPGLAYRQNGEIRRSAPRPFTEDLDSLPLPAWRFFEVPRYSCLYPLSGVSIPVMTARGCPQGCTFCVRAQGRRMRSRSLQSVCDELERGMDGGHRTFDFVDETFTIDRRRVLGLLEFLLRLPPERAVRWVAQTRVDRVDAELVRLMKKAGCLALCFGLEAGDQKALDSLGKDITIPQMIRAAEACRLAKMEFMVNVIVGAPAETPATLRETRRLVLSLKPTRLAAHKLVAFPGAILYEQASRGANGLRLTHEDWSRMHPELEPNLRVPGVTPRQVSWAHFVLYFRFYVLGMHFRTLATTVTFAFARRYLSGLTRVLWRTKRRVGEWTATPAPRAERVLP